MKMMQKITVNIVEKYVVNIVGRRMVIRIIIVIQVVILKSVIMMEESVNFEKGNTDLIYKVRHVIIKKHSLYFLNFFILLLILFLFI